MLIRAATIADIPGVVALASQAATAAQWPKEHYEQAILAQQPRRSVLVLEEQNAILAFLIARAIDREWELENIAVMSDARRRRLGTRIFAEFLNMIRQENAESIFLEVRESNHPARAFYQKHSFEEAGRRPNYYNHPKEDAITYRLVFS